MLFILKWYLSKILNVYSFLAFMKTIYIFYSIIIINQNNHFFIQTITLWNTVGKYQLCRHQNMWSCSQCCRQAQVLGPGQWPCCSLPEPFPHPPQMDSWRCVALQTAQSPRRTDMGQSIKSKARVPSTLRHRPYFEHHIAFCLPFHIFLLSKYFWVPCVVQWL